jgi:diacylglycerol kinase (ATP)
MLLSSEAANASGTGVRYAAVILNPASGCGQGARRRAELERLISLVSQQTSSKWQIYETAGPGGGTEAARRAIEEGADVVGAAGGDGTFGEVVNGLVGTGARLAVLPLGTGNDFSRGLGLNTDLSLAVDAMFHGTPKPIDLGITGGRYFINVAGCGFDAVVAERVNRGFRRLRGTAAYVAAVMDSLMTFRAANVVLEIDGRIHQQRAMLCSIANSPSYGGGMRIAPDARIDDGLFDVCLLAEAGKVEFLRAFPRVFRGTHVTHPKVTMLKARRIRVTSDPPLPVLIDGDVLGTTPVEFEIVPSAIEVMTP